MFQTNGSLVVVSCVPAKDTPRNKAVTLYPQERERHGHREAERKVFWLMFAFGIVLFHFVNIPKYHKIKQKLAAMSTTEQINKETVG